MAATTTPYAIAPDYAGKFKPSAAQEILAAVLNEKLQGKEFSADLTTQWTKEIAEVKTRKTPPAIGAAFISRGKGVTTNSQRGLRTLGITATEGG